MNQLSDAQKASLARMAPDLQFILSEREVSATLQVQLAESGIKTVGLFVSFVDTKAQLRDALAAQFNLDPNEAGISVDVKRERQMNCARLVDSWDTATKRAEEADRVQAEQKASRLPMTLSRSSHITLRQRYEKDHGRLQDKSWPCQQLIEKRFEEVEEGEVRADPLSEVVSVEEVQEDVIGAVMDRDGAIRMKKASKSIPLPKDSEELRNRLKILGVTFQLAAYKHSSRLWLSTTTPGVWRDHADFILGEDIWNFQITTMDFKVTPPWQVVLSYEFQVRKQACRYIMFENLDISAAMLKARKCTETKEKYFSTPVALSAAVSRGTKRPAEPLTADERGKGKGKSKGKAKGANKGNGATKKGKGKGKARFPKTKTPDGRSICYKFQDGQCNNASCAFCHVCANCLGDHPMSGCTSPIAPVGA